MGIRLDGTTDTISAPGSDLNLGQSGDSVKVASQIQLPTHGALSSRRININGAMQVAQRGTVVNSGNEYGGPDRFKFVKNEGAYTISQDTDVPAGSGFSNSYKIDVTSAGDPNGSAGNVVLLEYRFEGQDLQLVKKGTSAAEKLTIQFWIKTSVTGTYILELKDVDNSRYISKAYTVSSADTWEYKTVVFDADTTGAFDNDSNQSLVISWWLLAGSNFTSGTLSTTWTSQTNADRAVGLVNACSSTSNNIFFTGIQVEVGEKATPFEHRSYGDELAKCQRYYQVIAQSSMMTATTNGSTQIANIGVPLVTSMRAAPTTNSLQFTAWYGSSSSSNSTTTMTVTATDPSYGMYSGAVSGFSGLTDNRVAAISPNNATFQLSAEL